MFNSVSPLTISYVDYVYIPLIFLSYWYLLYILDWLMTIVNLEAKNEVLILFI